MTQALYNQDFYAWTKRQASLLQAEEFENLDLPNLVEEIEAMAQRERRELKNRLIVLIMHLLKWQYQSDYHSRSWSNTINTQRGEIESLLEDSPSLQREIPEIIARAYPQARKKAIQETGLLSPVFPAACPYTAEQILDEDWLPV
ncbi:MAG: DUF29 domain-containing protein [Chloroflexota bacterium]|nr:DUF29 domain-containing protein [Chloroflexota bacterium]